MEGSLEPVLMLSGHLQFLLIHIAFVSVCASLYPCYLFPAQPTLLPKRWKQPVLLKWISTSLHIITSQKNNLSISRSFHPCMDKVKIEAPTFWKADRNGFAILTEIPSVNDQAQRMRRETENKH